MHRFEILKVSGFEEGHLENFRDTIYLNQRRRYEAKLPFKEPNLFA